MLTLSNVEAQYGRRMVPKYQVHREYYPSRCRKGYGGSPVKGFLFKTHQLKEEVDEDQVYCV